MYFCVLFTSQLFTPECYDCSITSNYGSENVGWLVLHAGDESVFMKGLVPVLRLRILAAVGGGGCSNRK